MFRFILAVVCMSGCILAQPKAVLQADSLLEVGEWDSAINVLEHATQVYTAPDTNRAWILHRLGGVYYYNFEYEKAEKLLKEVASLRKHLLSPNNPQRAQTAYMQGVVSFIQNKFSDAEHKLLAANTIWEQQPLPPTTDLADGYKLLGELYGKVGDFGRGEVYVKKALEATERVYGKGPEFAEMLLLKSRLLDRKGQSRPALAALKQATVIFAKQKDPYYELSLAHSWQNTGLAYSHLEKPDSALWFLQKAAQAYSRIATEWEDPDAQKALFDNWDNQGIALRKLGRLDEAKPMHDIALDSLLRWYEGEHSDLAPTYDNLGDLAIERGRLDAAIQAYQKGLACLQNTDNQWADPSLAAKLLFGVATAYDRQYAHRPAPELAESILEAVQTADTLLRYIAETYLEDSSRQMLTSQFLQLYEIGLRAALNLNRDEDAFKLIVAGRSSLLRHAVHGAQAAKILGIPDSLIRKQRLLQAELAIASPDKRASILASMGTLAARMDRAFPAFLDFRRTRIPSLADFVQHVRKDELAILCFWGEKEVCFFIVEKNKHNWLRLSPSNLHAQVTSLITMQQDAQTDPGYLIEKSKTLLTDTLGLSEILTQNRHLLVLPDGPLAQLSWPGLSCDGVHWLVESMAIRVAPAVDLAFQTARRHHTGMLVYATAPWYGRFSEWPDLPMARATAAKAYSLFGGRLDTGNSARLDHFVSMAPLANILHIGAHGILNDEHPLEGGIQLADSMLTIARVYGMRLPARLAVLTACHSGAGAAQRGEGVMSMARAFAHAGCRSLVTSLWDASADATAYISTRFYEELKDGSSQELALQQAQLDYLSQAPPERRHPYYWSGISLTGEAGSVRTSSVWLVGLGVLLIAGMLLWAWLGRLKTRDL